ncbi:arsenic resistance N-acetyltransferase ArsN2 [Caenispirillum bisanense]|uniref:Amino-acid N-acetyltransferase n=1 Tax=Caenispirillum bisanense TaxID=414052 RepID=A0A286G6F7_9PROT|nr:arsenic resistance N-acetyltransferase ArsN2 [Caenispirillum bisanense]SOD91131.1 amino-acid N-acetyltransferase [Caenispirillum bisanense]
MPITEAGPADLTAVTALLTAAGLPADDIAAAGVRLWVSRGADGTVDGCAGLERCGTAGLLRSVAVAPHRRGGGLGGRLVATVETAAQASGLSRLYLLTTGDAALFLHHGYAPCERAAAPEGIRATRQFSGLCPAAARLLWKPLTVATVQS